MGVKKFIGLVGFYLFADKFKSRFVAGSTLQDAVDKAKFYKARGEKSVINILGEHAKDHNTANQFCEQIIGLIDLLAKEELDDVHIAEKPSQIGLDVSADIYRANKLRILKCAAIKLPHTLIETDAEDHKYREQVYGIALDLNRYFANQLICCQLNRSETTWEIIMFRYLGIPMRICKGNAYEGDIKKEEDLRKAFLENLQWRRVVSKEKISAFATHDLFLINAIAKEFGYCRSNFEFELLMGIEENLSKMPHLQGFTFRRYIPCDPNNQWRPYAKRRAEALVNIWLRNWWYKKSTEKRRQHVHTV